MASPAVKQVKRIVPGGHKPVAIPASPFPKAANSSKRYPIATRKNVPIG
jgi:hypothetical protein